MAALVSTTKQRNRMTAPSFLFVFCCVIWTCNSQTEVPEPEYIKKWAESIDNVLRDLNIKYYHIEKPYRDYHKLAHGFKSMKYEWIDEVKLVNEMSDTLAQMLRKKERALRLNVKRAEEVAAEYTWNNNLQRDDVHYVNAKEMLYNDIPLETDEERFGNIGVNVNMSSVHIPVEIYDGNIEILNGLNWSAALESQFSENYYNDDDILWQYFGSQTGFMRTFPATPWPVREVDLYDVRRQSWYTQGSSSPKDMMILVDTSGSTHGQSLQLMQNAVKSILDTLGENDFVNVVDFAETAKFSSKCLNHTAFVQANFRNKKQLERDVDNLVARGQAMFSEAIRFAFEKFEEFNDNETNREWGLGADCNKVIMLLTDGGTDMAKPVFEKYNWPNKTVRVFTYAVGPTPNPIHAVRWMACANKGFFSQIPAMGAIRTKVQDYIKVLERPLALAHAELALWSSSHENTYYDSKHLEYTEFLMKPAVTNDTDESGLGIPDWEVTYDPRGLGMMTTVTMPVYNRSEGSSNQTILGVMGVDVTTAKLEAKTPHSKIGPNGYSFAINPNGYVVFHPNLKTGGEFMTKPPNIDIMELEIHRPSKDQELANMTDEMVEGKTGQKNISTMFLSHDQRYVVSTKSRFAYTNIANTTFRLGLSVPSYQIKYPHFEGRLQDLQWTWETKDTDFNIYIAPWNYFKNMSKMREDLTNSLQDFVQMLAAYPDEKDWNMDLVLHLNWDLNKTIKNFEKDPIPGSECPSDRMCFAVSNGGMTIFDSFGDHEYMKTLSNPRESSLYKRAQHSHGCIFEADYVEGKRLNTSVDPKVTMACAVEIQENDIVIDKPVVSGVRMNYTTVMQAVVDAISKDDRVDAVSKHDRCTEYDLSTVCYLVDTGGFLVATNREDAWEQVGRFFGEVDPPIMQTMINKSYFTKTIQYDFQAACVKEKTSASAGFKEFHIPSVNLVFEVLNAGWWTSKLSWAFVNFNLFSWLFSPSPVVLAEDDDEGDLKPCVKAFQQYFLSNPLPTEGNYQAIPDGVTCKNCTRNFTSVVMPLTNLLFIVSDLLCEECEVEIPPVSQAPYEVSSEMEEEVICKMAQDPRHKRVPPKGCYRSDPREDSTKCGCASLQVSVMSCLLTVGSILWVCRNELR